jgi:hypothetical protein
MTTRNYKLSLKGEQTPIVYNRFEKSYKENAISNGLETALIFYGLNFYEINNTSVICSRKDNFSVESKTRNFTKYKYGNLRITGLEDNIDQIEKKIKSKGFRLKEIK